MPEPIPGDYAEVLAAVKGRIRSAQYAALKAVNKELINLYWDIGKTIVDRQQGNTWGQSVVNQLAGDIRREFPGVAGFSASNLWRMKLFYSAYASSEKLAPLVREIGWSHNVVILDRCKDPLQREFYLRMTARHGWSKNVLIHQIDNRTYEKTLTSQNNFDINLPEEIRSQAKLAVKDEYTFDFLELGDQRSERMLETAILARIEPFLKEMGGVFSFVGSQYRLEVGNQEYFVDLLLYHRRLKCLVALELKIGAFVPEYIGKMQFYLAVLDDRVRMEGENPSMGIILCRSKDKTVVEYALRESNKPIGVGTYTITETLPSELRGQLPEPAQVAMLLDGISDASH